MEKQNWVKKFVAIIFWTPVQYLIGGFNISLQNIEPGLIQNIAEYFRPAEFNIAVSKYYVTPGM